MFNKTICIGKFLILLLLCLHNNVQAQPPTFKQKAFVLIRFLQKNHYQPLQWNDTSSAMLYDKWLERLDEEKLFFTQTDIASLEPYKTKLDDELLGKDWKFFDASINIYRRRVQQVDSILQVLVAKPLDFSKPDNIVWPFNDYAANEQAIAQRWQRYLKWHVLDDVADDLADDKKPLKTEIPATFTKDEAAARLKIKRQETSYIKNLLSTPATFTTNMQDAYLDCIAWCYDPHTDYMNLNKKKEFETEMSASEYSAGFDYEENDKGDKVIGFLQPGGSAWRSGKLHTGDVILKIKTNGVETSVEDISSEQLNKILSGNSEADVEITIKTAAGEQKTIKLVKEKITDEESIVKSYVLRGIKNIAYINLPGFYSREDDSSEDIKYDGCANDVSKEIVKLKKDSITGLILDLRYNGGGSMWEAMQLAGIFIDIGPVASMKGKDGKAHFLKDPNRGTIYDGPMIVLINGASASASEFLSAALQDYNRAIIIGGTTYGKGTAQVVLPMDTTITSDSRLSNANNYTDFVKVTEDKFYRINGSTTQWKGVIPDIVLPDMYSDDSYREKANKSALLPDNSKVGMYEALKPLPFQQLKTKSEQRVAADPYFRAITAFTNWMSQNRKSQDIPLQWPAYAAHANKLLEMFKLLSEDDEEVKSSVITVSNNAFDKSRISMSSAKSKEINDVYLKHVQADKTVEEAYQIMMDWIGK
ncbi:MAG: carboxy terminal-processing peptidase [Ferruginibacter sp.]